MGDIIGKWSYKGHSADKIKARGVAGPDFEHTKVKGIPEWLIASILTQMKKSNSFILRSQMS